MTLLDYNSIDNFIKISTAIDSAVHASFRDWDEISEEDFYKRVISFCDESVNASIVKKYISNIFKHGVPYE